MDGDVRHRIAKKEVEEFPGMITGSDNIRPYKVGGLGMRHKNHDLKPSLGVHCMDLRICDLVTYHYSQDKEHTSFSSNSNVL
jgi:hypothetical protein